MGGEGLVPEPQHGRLISDVALMHANPNVTSRSVQRYLPRLGEGIGVEVARGDRAPGGGELADDFPAHSGPATGDDRDLPVKRLHEQSFGHYRIARKPLSDNGLRPTSRRSSTSPSSARAVAGSAARAMARLASVSIAMSSRANAPVGICARDPATT